MHHGGTDVVAGSQRRACASAPGHIPIPYRRTERGPGPAGTTGGIVPGPLPAGNAEATWLNAGAAEVQPWGTDNAPSEAARPAVAVTAAPPMPDELNAPAPEPTPMLSDDRRSGSPLPKALVAELERVNQRTRRAEHRDARS